MKMNQLDHDDLMTIPDLQFEILPGGCTEPVLHWGAVLVIIELARSSPAY